MEEGVCSIMNDRQLTAAVKNATTAERLAQLAKKTDAGLNPIHIAAILTKLANITKKGPNQVQSSSSAQQSFTSMVRGQQSCTQLLQQLMGTLKAQQCLGHCSRGLANITWALAKLQACPDKELLNMLLSGFCQQLSVAVPQDIANVLWGVAQITKDHGLGVLQQQSPPAAGSSAEGAVCAILEAASTPAATTAQQPDDASAVDRPSSAAVSSTDSAVAEAVAAPTAAVAVAAGCDAAVEPLQQQQGEDGHRAKQEGTTQPLLSAAAVHQLLQQLCRMLPLATSQTVSNIAWAMTVLQKCHGWCMCVCIPQIQQLVGAFSTHLHDAQPGHVQRVVHCITQLSSACADHAALAWIEWQPPPLGLLLQHLLLQRKVLKQYHVASVLRDVAVVGSLFMSLEDPAAGPGAGGAHAAVHAAAAAGFLADVGEGEDNDTPEVDEAEPLSLTEALVQGLVRSVFRRVVAANQVPNQLQSMAVAGGQQQAEAAAEEPLSPTSALVHQLVSGIFACVVRASSTADAFTRIMPQLQRLGLLSQCQALQEVFSGEQLAGASTAGATPYQSPHQSPFQSPYQGGGVPVAHLHAGFGVPPYSAWCPGMQPMCAPPYGMFQPPGMQPPPPPPPHLGMGVWPPYPGSAHGSVPRPFVPGPKAQGALPGMVPHAWPTLPFLQMPMGGAGAFGSPRGPFMPPGMQPLAPPGMQPMMPPGMQPLVPPGMQPMMPPGMPGFGFAGGFVPSLQGAGWQGGSSMQRANTAVPRSSNSSTAPGPSKGKAGADKQQGGGDAGAQNAHQRGSGRANNPQGQKPQRWAATGSTPWQQQPQSVKVPIPGNQLDSSTTMAAFQQTQGVKPQEPQLPENAPEDPASAVSTPCSSSSQGAMGFMNLRGIKKPAAASQIGSSAAAGLTASSSGQPPSPSPFESAVSTAEIAVRAAGGSRHAAGPGPVAEVSAASTAGATVGLGSSMHTSADPSSFRPGSMGSSGFASSTQTTHSVTSGMSESLSYTQINRGMVPLGSKSWQGSGSFSFGALSPASAAGTTGALATCTSGTKLASQPDQLTQQKPRRVSGHGAGAPLPNYQPGMKPLQPMQLPMHIAPFGAEEHPRQPQPHAQKHQPHPLVGSGLRGAFNLPGGNSSSDSVKPQPTQLPGMTPLPVSAGSAFMPSLGGAGASRGYDAEDGFLVLPNFTKTSVSSAGAVYGSKPPQGPPSSGGVISTSSAGLTTAQAQQSQLRVQQPLQPPLRLPAPEQHQLVQAQPVQATQVVFVQQAAQPQNVTYQTLPDGTLVQITTIQQPARQLLQQQQQQQPQVLIVDQSGSQQLQYVLQLEQHGYQGTLPAGAYSAVAAQQLQQVQAQQPQIQLVPSVCADQGMLSLPGMYNTTAAGYAVQQHVQAVGQHDSTAAGYAVQQHVQAVGQHDSTATGYTVQQQVQTVGQPHQQLLPVVQQLQQGVLQQVEASYAAVQGTNMLMPGHTNHQASGNVGLVQEVQNAQDPQQQPSHMYSTSSIGGVGGVMAGSMGLYGNTGNSVAYDLAMPGLQVQEQPGAADYVVMQASTGLGWGGQQAGMQYLQLPGGGQEYLAAVSGPGSASVGGQLGVMVDFNIMGAQGCDLQQLQQGLYTLPQGY